MPQIIQSLLFLTLNKREDICEPNSNQLSWKKSKHLITESLPQAMATYSVWGQKKDEYKKYQSINYCEKLVKELVEDDVKAYHPGVYKLWKWLTTALDARKKDISRRLVTQKQQKEDRERALEAKEKREADRTARLEEEEAVFNEANKDAIEEYNRYKEEQERLANQDYGEEAGSEDEEDKANIEPPELPVFDRKEAEEKFDDENPEIIIPPEIVDDIDNDWQLDEEEREAIITQFLAAKNPE